MGAPAIGPSAGRGEVPRGVLAFAVDRGGGGRGGQRRPGAGRVAGREDFKGDFAFGAGAFGELRGRVDRLPDGRVAGRQREDRRVGRGRGGKKRAERSRNCGCGDASKHPPVGSSHQLFSLLANFFGIYRRHRTRISVYLCNPPRNEQSDEELAPPTFDRAGHCRGGNCRPAGSSARRRRRIFRRRTPGLDGLGPAGVRQRKLRRRTTSVRHGSSLGVGTSSNQAQPSGSENSYTPPSSSSYEAPTPTPTPESGETAGTTSTETAAKPPVVAPPVTRYAPVALGAAVRVSAPEATPVADTKPASPAPAEPVAAASNDQASSGGSGPNPLTSLVLLVLIVGGIVLAYVIRRELRAGQAMPRGTYLRH